MIGFLFLFTEIHVESANNLLCDLAACLCVVKDDKPEPVPCVSVPPPSPTQQVKPSPQTPPAAAAPSRPVVTALGKDTVQPIVGIRKAMSKAMARAQLIPHFGYDDEVITSPSFITQKG